MHNPLNPSPLTQVARKLTWLLACALPLAASGQDNPSPLRINGFGTLGAVHANTDFGGTFSRDVSLVPGGTGLQLKPDSRLGIQANYEVSRSVELVGQVVAKDQPAGARKGDPIEWAFASFRPTDDVNIRLGRVGADLYLISDYRNVGIGYLTARPTVDFYGVMSIGSLDGIDIAKTWSDGDTLWRAKGYFGQSKYHVNGKTGSFKDIGGLVLSREQDGLTVRGTVAQGTINIRDAELTAVRSALGQVTQIPLPTVAAQAKQLLDAYVYENIHVKYLTLGVSYDRDNWVATAEIMRIRSNSGIASGRGGYFVIGRRFGDLTPYVGMSRLRSTDSPYSDPNWGQALMPLAPLIGLNTVQLTQVLGQQASATLNNNRIDQSTATLGVRWDVDPRMAVKAQWDRVRVRRDGGLLWQGQASGGRANVLSVVVDFMF